MNQLETPTNQLILKYITKFENDERYYTADKAIVKLIEKFPNNSDFEGILLKCSVINSLYSTNIFDIYRIAKNILQLNIDNKLLEGSVNIVNEIAIGHGIPKPKGDGDRNFYSFATKYCNWHNKNEYPIYDTFVEKILLAYRAKDNFSNFKTADLKVYKEFKKVIIDFKNFYSISHYDLKEIDKFLWIYGKEQFPNIYKNKLEDDMHLHYKLDEIFSKGHLWKHRTLRTIFDKNSSEWNHTTIDEKLEIIYKVIDSGKLTFEEMKDGYIDFYLNEVANKEQVLDSLEESIDLLKLKSLEYGGREL